MKRLIISLALLSVFVAGCGNFPLQPNNQKAYLNPAETLGWPSILTIYDDQIKVDAQSQVWNYSNNPMTFSFSSPVSPHSGQYCLEMDFNSGAWNSVVLVNASVTNPVPVDLSSGKYTRCVFWARASQNSVSAKFEAGYYPGVNTVAAVTPTLSTAWQEVTVPLNTSFLSNMTAYFEADYPSPVCTIYVDDISYQQ